MQRKKMLLLSMLMIAALVLAACPAPGVAPAADSGDTAAEVEAEAEPTEAPAEEVAETGGDSDADMVIWADAARITALTGVVEDFETEYGLTVNMVEKEFGAIRDDLKVAGPAGEGPDMIIGAHDWLGELVENGLLAEIELGDESAFLPAAVQAFTYEGKIYGMPYATENVALVYNPDLVSEVPATWSEVAELAAGMEETQLFLRQEGDPYHFFPIQTAFGGYVFGLTDDGYDASDVGVDSEGSIAALSWLEDMYDAGSLNEGSAVDYDIMHAEFEAGNAAMIITGPWALDRIRESGVSYAVAAIPGETHEAQPFLGVQGFMVSAFSDDPLLAQTFLQEVIATDGAMQAIFDADPRPSAYLSVRDGIDDEDLAAFAKAGANGLAMPAIPEMSAVWAAWGDAITLVSQGSEDAEAAFTNAAEQIRTAIAGE